MKPSSKAAVIVIALLIIGAGAFILTREETTTTELSAANEAPTQSIPANTNSQAEASTEPEQANQSRTITADEVAQHASANDCWTIIEGVVYDITSYIPRHPGGSNILSACGVDGTDFFNGSKSGQNGGSNNHGNSSQALSALATLKIGTLAN